MTTPSKILIQTNYSKFYKAYGIDETNLLKKYETVKNAEDGYMCICCYCLQQSKCLPIRGVKECCKTGIPCKDFKPNNEDINKEALISG